MPAMAGGRGGPAAHPPEAGFGGGGAAALDPGPHPQRLASRHAQPPGEASVHWSIPLACSAVFILLL